MINSNNCEGYDYGDDTGLYLKTISSWQTIHDVSLANDINISFQSPQKNLLNKQGDAMKLQPTVAMGNGYPESNPIAWYNSRFDSSILFFASYQNHRNGKSKISCLLFCNVQAILQ